MAKLTLSVHARVVQRAKRSAKHRGVSISKKVDSYFDAVSEPALVSETAPILNSLQGVLKRGGVDDYRKHLLAKYR